MPRKVEFVVTNELKLEGIVGFVKRKVTPHGTGAKVTCPKEYLGKTVYLVRPNEPWQPEKEKAPSQGADSKP
jgi:putative transposon-encoded protein